MNQMASRRADRAPSGVCSKGDSWRDLLEAAQTPARKSQRRSVNREIPAVPKASEQTVDEWGERRALGCHEDYAQCEQKEDDGNEPPFLANSQEIPELFEDGELVHGDTR